MHPTMCVCIHYTIPCSLQVPGKASRDAVLRILKAEGFASIVAMRKPLLSTVNKRKRKQFALGHRGYDWGNVVWSDEKVFNVRPGEKVRCWWRRSGNKYAAKYVRTTVAHPQSLMVWAAMDSSGGICLRRCPPRVNAVPVTRNCWGLLCPSSGVGVSLMHGRFCWVLVSTLPCHFHHMPQG